MVEKMNQEMGSERKFVYVNTYDIVTEIIQHYRQVRFSSLLQLLPANEVLQTSEHEMAILRIQFLLCINTSGRYLS